MLLSAAISDLASLSQSELGGMARAGAEVRDCLRGLESGGSNVLKEVLRGQGRFREWDHFPKGDIYDAVSHAQYYYHAHPKHERPREHGHFHTFLRPFGMPAGMEPADLPGNCVPLAKNEALSHLIAISMNKDGEAIGLFTTNRWVTGETWYDADDVIAMLDRFRIDDTEAITGARRAAYGERRRTVHRWITGMLRLFRPQIVELLRQRDAEIATWNGRHRDSIVLEDQRIAIPSEIPVSVP
ncbi:MAG: hypothetical protein WAN51_02265, partial [Alphaproteobacteria bacterium]